MGKYFSNDSELVNYASTDDLSVDMTNQQTIIPNMVKSQPQTTLSNNQKETLSSANQTSIEDKIDEISEQNEQITNHFEQIERERVKQTFKSFDELEVLERLNQITFLLVEQNDRISRIESFLKNQNSNISKTNTLEKTKDNISPREQDEIKKTPDDISKMTPTERHIYETEKADNINYMDPNSVRKELNNMKTSPTIPTEGFDDKGVVLEELIPDKDPEAYQAAYSAMNEVKKRNPTVGYSKSPKGGMNGSGAGF